MGSARETAVLTLAACEKQGAWSDGHLKHTIRERGLDRRDAALATRLCYGVLQNKLLLDWRLGRVCSMKLDKLDIRILCDLRVAAYQLLFLDKIPASAAVNEAVELAKRQSRNPRAAGLVNGVLRALLREEPRKSKAEMGSRPSPSGTATPGGLWRSSWGGSGWRERRRC